jgi:hypothetical protein
MAAIGRKDGNYALPAMPAIVFSYGEKPAISLSITLP